MPSNRIRIFSDLVSVDAWHLPFTTKRMTVSLHADVSFSTARMGGEPDSPVRFTVDLKEAELTVLIPETEQLVIERASVARMDPTASGVHKSRSVSKAKRGAAGKFSLTADPSQVSAGGSLSASAGFERESVEEVSVSRKFSGIITSHSVNGDGNNRWHFKPGAGPILDGKPWDAKKTPLMKIKDQRDSKNRILSPTVRLELSCRREDLNIKNIVLKDRSILRAAMAKIGFRDRMDAAEAFIRNKLVEEGLPAPDMSEGYAVISLAQVSASDEG